MQHQRRRVPRNNSAIAMCGPRPPASMEQDLLRTPPMPARRALVAWQPSQPTGRPATRAPARRHAPLPQLGSARLGIAYACTRSSVRPLQHSAVSSSFGPLANWRCRNRCEAMQMRETPHWMDGWIDGWRMADFGAWSMAARQYCILWYTNCCTGQSITFDTIGLSMTEGG